MNNHRDTLAVSPLNLPAHTSISDIFKHFAHKPWAMLLDSADSQRQDGRFDIMVASPIATVTTKDSTSDIWHLNTQQQRKSQLPPLSLVNNLLQQYMPREFVTYKPKTKLPFLAGALGLFGYDLGKCFETLPNKNADEYTTPDMAVGIYSWSIIKDNVSQQFYLCYLSEYPHPECVDIQQLITAKTTAQSFSLTGQWQANMSKDEYTQKLSRISYYLQSGDCYQINLAQRFSASYKGDEWQAYQRLRLANQAPFSAFIRLGDNVVMSISPERFLSVDEQKVQTKPIKGTRPRSKDPKQDKLQAATLSNAEKDRAENLMIVDLLRNDLSKHCQPGSVAVPDLFKIESFAAVHHLVSTVTATLLPDSSALDLLQGAFPGGSITGAPKIRAMQIIDELEPNNRNIYCGSIGYIGLLGDMDTNICIRTLLCENTNNQHKIHCWAGGGIVLDSIPQDEYQESLDKVSKILPILSTPHVAFGLQEHE
ncbi:aminodeoxychorismate synthase component I [uncultured Paraglaciecola sp.]|uniref:aminodeoxychorismate synthase component I n=1 Tax=uncultured Paraglaciecola sp. TaxID=1765024 RepID=UPI002639FACC|nr:aminodeoxychorismate synthase component I [uncultured Paraglaciecola sp.]